MTDSPRTPCTDVITAFGISTAAPTAAPTVPPTISPTGPATARPVRAPLTAPSAVVDCANALPEASNDAATNETANLIFITSSLDCPNRRHEEFVPGPTAVPVSTGRQKRAVPWNEILGW